MNGDHIHLLLDNMEAGQLASHPDTSTYFLSVAIGILFCGLGGVGWCIFLLHQRLKNNLDFNPGLYEIIGTTHREASPNRQSD